MSASCGVVGLGVEPAPERYRGGPTFSRRRGRLCECSPCRYSGRAICRFYVSIGFLLSACLQGAEGWRGTLVLLAKSVTARSERKLVRMIGFDKSFSMSFFCDFCFFPNLFILCTALKLFRF